jgi:glucose/arabinose dehydrogenase
MRPTNVTALACLLILSGASALCAQNLEVPRQHDRPPGPPASAEEAVAKMTVPEGFTVEIVAAEPQIMNPVAMFIDEQGRYWITESFEYPRREPGPGRDRIKVLEDTDGDGQVDKVIVFAEGLNIPSGIAVGHGGVWVGNAPDILFLQDTDGDLKADKQEVVVTGFGRDDTHELPNAFTWGPDGWLYGLNGVFNPCHVKYDESNPNFAADHAGWEFTCALWRIHPRTREFQVFAEGTSNPWGIATNDDGDFFISACVIDHLWHIAEDGYYIRQGGPYPAYTWPIESIVEHKHQKAAYCGITWFDSDCYPEEYRQVLYMGNIHGGCINADVIEPHGSTYKGSPHPGFAAKPDAWANDEYNVIAKTGDDSAPKLADLLTANDPWFMPVAQATGPDGCLYVLDWYDRYHCYQDANADPAGIERERGRLYRIRYGETPHAQPFDLAKNSDAELIQHLAGNNEYIRATARRLLAERSSPEIASALEAVVFNDETPRRTRLQALYALVSCGPLTAEQTLRLFAHSDATFRAWGVRAAGDAPTVDPSVREAVAALARDPSPVVQRQVAVAAVKIDGIDALRVLTEVLVHSGDDELIPHIVWQNLHPLLETHSAEFLKLVKEYDLKQTPNLADLMPRVTERILGRPRN